MKKIALIALAMCFAASSCQEENLENIPQQNEQVTIRVQLPSDDSDYVLNYSLQARQEISRAGQLLTGAEEIGPDGKVTLPVGHDDVLGGRLVVTEKGQQAYNLENLEHIVVDYNEGTDAYIGQLDWNNYNNKDGNKPVEVLPMKAKVQILTSTEDFECAVKSGLDRETLTTQAVIVSENGEMRIPNSRELGTVLQIEGQDKVLLYENDFIVYEKCLQQMKLRVMDGEGYEYDFPLYNLPVCPGSTTLVAGVSLTSETKFEIIINPEFDGDKQQETKD